MTRYAVTGMGGDIGTGVAMRLDREPGVEMLGLDIAPPRRRLLHADFHMVPPADVDRRADLMRRFDPEVIVHLGIYEPHSRSNPADASRRTAAVTRSVLEAARDCPSLRRIVMRSGIEVYGRGRGTPLRPDEDAPLAPSSRFGRSLAAAEEAVTAGCADLGVESTVLRFAPIVGPYIPSPLGRYLRLPVVPVSSFVDAPIQLVDIDDAHDAIFTAVTHHRTGTFNVVGEGAVTGSQAVSSGGRLAVPVVGPGWLVARAITAALGSPLPEHCAEALRRGQTADGSRITRELGFRPRKSTPECVAALFAWETIHRLAPDHRVAA